MSHPTPLAPRPSATLHRHHLAAHPVWEYCLDSEGDDAIDESHVRPCATPVVPRGTHAQFVVSATITLRDKTPLPGAVAVDVLGDKVLTTPMFVFLLDRQLDLVSMETDRLLSRYTKSPGNRVVRWTLDVVVEGERRPRTGRISRSIVFQLASLAIRLVQLRQMRKR